MNKWSRRILILLCTLFLLSLPLLSQSKENGAIEGKVLSNEEQPLPGVEVIVSSPNMIGGTRTVLTNDEGKFRFVALLPGVYTVEAKLEGFSPMKKEGIKLSVGTTLTVDFSLSLGQLQESVTVKGVLPMIDVKDSQTAVANLSKEFILNIPSTQFVSNIVNLAPGVTQDSAFGASTNGIQYQIDGVDVSDPELHTAYVFMDYNNVEEVKVSGIGAPAEYDGFTGAVFNTVTKSGSNNFTGMFDSYFQPTSWNSSNSDDPYFAPPQVGYYNAHFNLGGAFKKDTLWFLASLQYEIRDTVPSNFPEHSIYKQPRALFKLTWQINRDHRLAGFVHGDLYNGTYRGGGNRVSPEATRKQESPEFAFNLNHVWTISDRLFLESKFAGFMSYYKLIPSEGYEVAGHYDLATKWWTKNAMWLYNAYRNRFQFNSALSLYTDKFIAGTHDFKFGIDTEYNPTKTDSGYSSGEGYWDWEEENYVKDVQKAQTFNANNFRFSAFVQDNWSVTDKLKINPGLRINYYRGSLSGLGTVFTPQVGIAPRLGVTYDIFDDHSTVIKAHYGKYYDNIITSYYSFNAVQNPLTEYEWIEGAWVEQFTINYENRYKFADKIRMPYMNQYTIGVEREILKDFTVGVSYIYRENKDFIDAVATNAQFNELTYTDPETNRNYTIYDQINFEDTTYIVTNPKKGDYPIVAFTPERKYQGVQLLINKRFSNRWMVNASYTYGRATGNNDNDPWDNSNSSSLGFSQLFQDKNAQINADGHLTVDPTHMVKIQGTVVLPLDIYLSPNLTYISGNTYNRMMIVEGLSQGEITYIRSDPLGFYRLPANFNLDLRLEKQFKIGKFRIGAVVDVYNVFNNDTVTAVITDAGEYFQDTDAIMNPRAFRAGLRLYFNQ